MKTWTAKALKHRGVLYIALSFPYDEQLKQKAKAISGSRWSQTLFAWLIPDTPENRVLAGLPPEEILNPQHEASIQSFMHWLRSKRYSENTIRTYTDALRSFLLFYNDILVEQINESDIIRFNNEYILARQLSSSFQNQVVNAIKLFFRTIEKKQLDPELIHRPRREKLLPNVLSKEEVKLILEAHRNTKHKTMLSLIYSCGLRCGELLSLKPEHIDANRNLLIIKQGKGNKDRIAPLSDKTIAMLRAYYKDYKPKVYLFEGQVPGEPYDNRSLQVVLKQALRKVNIQKPVTLHWLRHSYATHLLEAGTDLRYIQEILGHKSSRTTEIYTHVSTKSIQHIRSPFDNL
ncbi:MAG: Tyrosine recombinase XerC [Bacteroidota bacterium]|jgi:integrase/recombinase XerD